MPTDDLFSRLNALKAPTKAPKARVPPSGPHPSIKPKNDDDDITARFRRLASGDGSSSSSPQPRKTPDDLRDLVATIPSERVGNDEDDQSLDDLLKDLGADQNSWLNHGSEEDRVSNLLKEAKLALPQRETEEHEDENKIQSEDVEEKHIPGLLDKNEAVAETEGEAHDQDTRDEKDADDYISQLMADIELRRRQGIEDEDNEGSASGDQPKDGLRPQARTAREATPLDDLPSAPSTAPVLAFISDDDLEARFASLSLPSTPTNKPTTKTPTPKTKSNLPTYTEEDIESWCQICNEDATLRCLGCEGEDDLYCQPCWVEGHRGPDAGYEEKRHRAVLFNKGGGKEKRKRSLAAA